MQPGGSGSGGGRGRRALAGWVRARRVGHGEHDPAIYGANMSSLLRPVGHLPASVYWVRRALVLAVLVGLVVLLLRVVGGGEDPKKSAATTPQPSPTSSPSGSPSQSAGVTPSSSASQPPKDTHCDGRDVRVSVLPAVRTIASGRPLDLTVRLSAAREQCTAAVDPIRLSVTISSGNDQIWTTSHCRQTIPKATLILAKGKDLTSTVRWDGHRSGPGCLPGQPVAKAGTYVVEAMYDGRASIQQAFRIT
jgi:hypothetical protein